MSERVILRDVKDALGSRYLAAFLTVEGDVVIEGQDVGDGVEQVFGDGIREYEWTYTIHAAHIPTLRQALAASGDVLAALRERFSGDDAASLKQFLEDRDIPHDVWTRLGD